MGNNKSYDTKKIYTEDAVQFIFVSKGKIDIVKAIQYHYVQEFLGRRLYNLGFGDYNFSTGEISDDINSNNGDMYLVFYTVLGTIVNFFETLPEAMLMVRGSDSSAEFEPGCRKNCKRNCTDKCEKLNRRIRIYRDYVNKNFDLLNEDYIFYGGLDVDGQEGIEDYVPARDYKAVFLRKR